MDPTVRARGRDARTAPLLVAALAVAVVVAASCVAVLLVVQPASARAMPARLQITDLGTLRGGTFSSADDINNRGQVVGSSERDTNNCCTEQALLWEDGRMTGLGKVPPGHYSYAEAINDRGQVAGWHYVVRGPGEEIAFLWEDGEMTNLGTLPGGKDYSYAFGINERGQVVGSSETTPGEQEYSPVGRHAFLWEGGRMRDLGTLGGDTSIATDINDRGQVVGSSETASEDGYYHAVLWSKRNPHWWRSRGSATGG